MTATGSLFDPIKPSEEDVHLARRGSSALSRLATGTGEARVFVSHGRETAEVPLPEIAYQMLRVILQELSQGHAVALAPVDRELTTQQAADLLNVSRPHLVKVLEAGKIPFRKVGSHRRVRLGDLLEYRARQEAEAEQAFADLVAQAQELRMGYE